MICENCKHYWHGMPCNVKVKMGVDAELCGCESSFMDKFGETDAGTASV